MFKILLASVTTICAILFLLGLIRGKKYDPYVENLDSLEYFLKNIYIVGFGLAETKLFHLRGRLEKNLRSEAKLVWGEMYAEYYTQLTWAQFLSLAILILGVGAGVSSLVGDTSSSLIFFLIFVIMVFVVWNMSMTKMKEAVTNRREACEYEFPNMVSKLSLMVNSGMTLREAWFMIAEGKEGELYDLMKDACNNMKNGMSEVDAIHRFGVLSDSVDIKKFTSILIQGMEKGSSEMTAFLTEQSSELWAHKRQLALQRGEVAAGKLVIPLGLMFGGIILIIVAAAMQSMSF